MSYRNEAAFGHKLDEALRGKGYGVHNIQSPTTERGIPHRFVQKDRLSAWIELKNIRTSIREAIVSIPYKEGQQKWLYQHFQNGGRSFTAIAGSDGILVIKNEKILPGKLYHQGEFRKLVMSHLYSATLDEWLQTFAY